MMQLLNVMTTSHLIMVSSKRISIAVSIIMKMQYSTSDAQTPKPAKHI